MKTKKTRLISLITGVLSLAGLLLITNTGSATDNYSESNGWRQYAMRKPHLYCSPVHLEGGIGYVPSSKVPLINLNGSADLDIIDCCKPCGDEHSWCNFNADDARCRD